MWCASAHICPLLVHYLDLLLTHIPHAGFAFNRMLTPLWLPWWHCGKEPTCQYRRLGFNLWIGKIP